MIERVTITSEAMAVVDELRQQHPSIIFHQSGGCCDGSAPMCLEEGELMLDDSDVLLGEIHGCEFYMSKDQYEYWKHTQIIVDVVDGRGASFSLEIPMGVRFISKSRLFSDEELTLLASQTNNS
jgi:uncharacterized protein (DUF779 family)